MWRARPVFISSTFADMQAERDHLRWHVFPALEELLRKRRHNLEWVDLRIGVATASLAEEEARERQVLKVCLAEVRRCRPFLIVLLGDRYGWVPRPELTKAAAVEEGFTADVEGRSVTELEIDFGTLAGPGEQPRSYFYFRKPLPYAKMPQELAVSYSDAFDPDPQAAARASGLKTLKERIEVRFPDRVRPYSAEWDEEQSKVVGLEAWGDQVLKDLWAELDAETASAIAAPETKWQQGERDALEDYIEDRARNFVGRQTVLSHLLRHAASPDHESQPQALCLTAAAGGGKSAIFGELVRRLRASDAIVLVHAAGASVRSHSVESMLLRWIEELAVKLGTAPAITENADPDAIVGAFQGLVARASGQRRVVLAIDALDQFEATVQSRHLTWLPHTLPPNVRVIATAIPGEASEAIRQRPGWDVFALGPLDQAEARSIAAGICARYHRELEPEVMAALLSKRAGDGFAWGMPLWLVVAVEELNLLDADAFTRARQSYAGAPAERLRALMIDVVNALPPDVLGLYRTGFERAEDLFGVRPARVFLGLIASGRSGWRDADFRSLLPQLTGESWNELRFASLRRLFRGQLRERRSSGQWDCAHAQMREAIRTLLAAVGLDERGFHAAIAAHLLELPREDPLRQSETMAHLIASQYWEGASLFLGDPDLSDGETHGATRILADALLAENQVALGYIHQLVNAFTDQPETHFVTGHLAERLLFNLDEMINARVSRTLLQDVYALIESAFDRLLKNAPHNENWRHCLGICNERIGEILMNSGELNGALNRFERRHQIALGLVEAHPSNLGWMRELGVSYTKLGTVFERQGRLADALQAFLESLSIADRITTADPNNMGWQRDLSVAHVGVGDILAARRRWADALAFYNSGLAIVERLAGKEPGNRARQHDYSTCLVRLGLALENQHQLGEALKVYRAYVTAMERLTQIDPENNAWQEELSTAYGKVGEVLEQQGHAADALNAHHATLAIIERLAKNDPVNTRWQYNLSIANEQVGDAYKALGDPAETIRAYRASQQIMARLADADQANVPWQRNTAVCYAKLADVLAAEDRLSEALDAYQGAVAIRERLAKAYPGNAAWPLALGVTLVRIADVQRRQGYRLRALITFCRGFFMMAAIILGIVPKVVYATFKFARTGTLDAPRDPLR
jgi:tetratricopeptide (TPR) repeat protein